MGWILAFAALGLLMTTLTIAELRHSTTATTAGDRVVTVFVLVVGLSTLAIAAGLILLAAQALP
jgi:hypothetical protein